MFFPMGMCGCPLSEKLPSEFQITWVLMKVTGLPRGCLARLPCNLTQPMANRLKLLGITYLVGKNVKFKLLFQGPLAKWVSSHVIQVLCLDSYNAAPHFGICCSWLRAKLSNKASQKYQPTPYPIAWYLLLVKHWWIMIGTISHRVAFILFIFNRNARVFYAAQLFFPLFRKKDDTREDQCF